MFASTRQSEDAHDPVATDPPLLQKHSQIKSFTTSQFIYEDIRVFFHPHEQMNKLPRDPSPLPLLVFVHGLGGSAAQFHSLLITLVHVTSCLVIDLPGCGRSKHATSDWEPYRPDNLVELLQEVIEQHRDVKAGQKVVLIGHSMGTALAARLANKHVSPPSLRSRLSDHVVGLIAICPSAGISPDRASMFKLLLRIPEWIFNLWRAWDRRGGPESASVKRFLGPDADAESKRLQNRFNCQSRTPVFRRMAWGAAEELPGEESWNGLDIPVLLVAGENDNVTPPSSIDTLESWIKQRPEMEHGNHACGSTTGNSSAIGHTSSSSESEDKDSDLPPQPSTPEAVVVKQKLKGTHAIHFSQPAARILAVYISEFLSTRVSKRLDPSWQLHYLSREGKWDVKNLAKWQKVEPVSSEISGVFRAMKTLRQIDETHNPETFVKNYGAKIGDVVDISHQAPVYDPKGLEDGGIRYHKFATVSKIPPPDEEVDLFIQLIDRLRAEQKERAEEENRASIGSNKVNYVVGVHCHYGFNRTGYFIVCYLVDRCGYSIDDAIKLFARARPDGIRHQHFLDKLYLRYAAHSRV
ncbi:uncharacterized protein MKZ38_007691 [Zalerion maritima]|uniref:Tyrosine specific protein phosphatases domain-containing protein n=1 Tax=Zalerion maritima TaxID=339359 RepID=A0AAD5RIM7_9PEZI|nr:uncharacterized protein MKZ38_007691 [Zalerion maritima]